MHVRSARRFLSARSRAWSPLLCMLGLTLLSAMGAWSADNEVLVIEQSYNIVESGKDGPVAKDTRQVLYISKDLICIDEMGGRDDSKPTESILLDMKNKKIINLNHVDRKMVTEDFETRRKKIKRKKEVTQEDLKAQPPGAQRERMQKLFRAMLDDDRKYELQKKPLPAREIAGVKCESVRVVDVNDPSYTPLEAYMHPDIELPHDNAEVLYLIMLIGEKMSDFLRHNRNELRKVPMELHLDLAAGGTLDTKVLSVKRVAPDKLNLAARGSLGDPFVVPEYEERMRRPVAKPDTDVRAD
jgi:hypothetical protein